MQPMQGDPEAVMALEPIVAGLALYQVFFILLGEDGEQDGDMEWCVIEALDGNSAKERAVDAMGTFYGQDVQWMGTAAYWEEDPAGYPDYLDQIVEGVWI